MVMFNCFKNFLVFIKEMKKSKGIENKKIITKFNKK